MSRLWPSVRRRGFDTLIAIGAVGAALEVALQQDPTRLTRTSPWFAAPAAALVVLPLLGRRRLPFAAPLSVWVLATGLSFIDGALVVGTLTLFVGGLAASFLLGQVPDTIHSRLGLAVVVCGMTIIVAHDPDHGLGEFVIEPILVAIAWIAGFALRERSEQAEAAEERASHAEREREAAARIAVAEERARIARELHDIVAHSVSVMVLQVGAVRHRLPSSADEDREALRGVEQTGRAALAEMRRLLGAMRYDGDTLELAPQPGLEGLDALLEAFGHAGLPVRLRVDGEPHSLPRALDLSAYRIVQEGLTNALKHSHATRVDVLVRHGADELRIDVRDDGVGPATGDGLGHGLVGVRERVKICGGEMTAGRVNGGGFVLSTCLPLDGNER